MLIDFMIQLTQFHIRLTKKTCFCDLIFDVWFASWRQHTSRLGAP